MMKSNMRRGQGLDLRNKTFSPRVREEATTRKEVKDWKPPNALFS
jgi:hypothetical protein